MSSEIVNVLMQLFRCARLANSIRRVMMADIPTVGVFVRVQGTM